MKWTDVILTRRQGPVLRGDAAKFWIERTYRGLVIDRGNGVVLMKVGGGTAYTVSALRDALLARSGGAVVDFTSGLAAPVRSTPVPNPVRPTKDNAIRTPASRLSMHLDVDRDGRIDDEPANHPAWVWGRRPEGCGAVVLAKLRNYDDGEVVAERAEIQFRWSGPYVEGWTAALTVDKPEAVRVFDANATRTARQEGATEVLGRRETGHTYQLAETPDLGGVDFGGANATPPKVAIAACKATVKRFAQTSYPDADALKEEFRTEFLTQVKTEYRSNARAETQARLGEKRSVLESLLNKKLNFGGVREARKAFTGELNSILSSDVVLGKTFATFDDLQRALVEAAAKRLLLPGDIEFTGRFDELYVVLEPAAYRPSFKENSRYEFTIGVPIFDAVAASEAPTRATSLWIEAVDMPDDPADSAWEVTLTFTFTPPRGRGDPTEQKAVLRIAPWLMSNDLDPTAQVFAKNIDARLTPMAPVIEEFAGQAKAGFVPVTARSANEKGFLRDVLKSGYATAPYKQDRVVMTGLDPRTYLMVDDLVTRGRPDVVLLKRPVPATKAASQDNGGNYMVSPPSAKHPFGRIIYGHRPPLLCNHAAFYDAQQVQSPIRIDATWLSVGHADEMISFLPDRSKSPRPDWAYKLVFANSRLALLMLLETAAQADAETADVGTVIERAVAKNAEHRYAPIDGTFIDTHYPKLEPGAETEPVDFPATFEPNGAPPAEHNGAVILGSAGGAKDNRRFSRISARSYLKKFRAHFEAFARQTQPRIDAVRQQLMEELDLKESDLLDVPVLFHGNVPITADCVNMLVLNTEEQTRCLVPKPFGPVFGGEYVYERYIHDQLTALRATFRFQDDWFDFHIDEGEIHCGTNQLPVALAEYRWWEMDKPGVAAHDAAPAAVVPVVPNAAVEVLGIQNVGNTCYLGSTLQVLLHSNFVPDPNALLAPLSVMVGTYRAQAAAGSYTQTSAHVRYTTTSAAALRDQLVTARLVTRGREEDPCPVWEHILGQLGVSFNLRVRKRYTLRNQQARQPTANDVVLQTSGWGETQTQAHSIVRIEPGTANTLDAAWTASWARTTGPMGTLNSASVGRLVYTNLPQTAETTTWDGAPPAHFVVQLKRFRYDDQHGVRKIVRPITVGARLRQGNRDYALRGVILHIGDTPTSGHYVAYVKARTSGNWFKVNDSSVEAKPEAHVLDQARLGYMFYFERV